MKRLSIILFSLLFSITAYSQGVDFGIKFGANFANISDVSGLDNKTGFHAGAFAAIKFNDNVALQGELLYSQQGAKFSPGDFNLDYVNVPVIVKYYLVQGLNIQLGPQFGFLVNDNIDGGDPEAVDFSAAMGVGYDLPFGLRIDGRYNLGLTDISKNGDGKNQVFSLALGYSFL
ncbi:MAG: PorT family protein [Flavobacteriaceae bacterium]|nr:PorT family protein [Flavobacteriaceae bacterium]